MLAVNYTYRSIQDNPGNYRLSTGERRGQARPYKPSVVVAWVLVPIKPLSNVAVIKLSPMLIGLGGL